MASRYVRLGSTSNPEVKAWGRGDANQEPSWHHVPSRSGYQCWWTCPLRKPRREKLGAAVGGFPALDVDSASRWGR